MGELNQVIDKPFRVLCIDDKNQSDYIEDSQLLKKGHEYIVVNIFSNILGSGDTAYKLLGINPDPFKGYLSSRFKIMNLHSVN